MHALWRILAKVGERHAVVAVVNARDTKLRGRPSRAPLPAREAERRATLAHRGPLNQHHPSVLSPLVKVSMTNGMLPSYRKRMIRILHPSGAFAGTA